MAMARVGVIVALAGSCISPVMKFGAGKSKNQAQHDTMASFTPARLTPEAKWGGQISTRKIRVWADNQYRAQNVKWQHSFDEPLEFANAVLSGLFGLQLVAEYIAWDRHIPGSTLADDLVALEERDPGNDVFVVIGLTSSLPLVSATFEEIGLASLGGRHLMMRGYADLEERKLYADAFSDLRADERELALDARRRHKTAVVLLHEIAHDLGVEHEADVDTIMNASYSHRAGSFSAATRQRMLAEIDRRLKRASGTPAAEPATLPDPGKTAVKPAGPPHNDGVHHAPIAVRVTKSGKTMVEGKTLDTAELSKLLGAAFEEDPETEIVINSDRTVPVGAVSDVIDRAKAVGLTKFKLGYSGL
jgi:biopolymer transport protein ExbD/predicted Zn-dependent protease with MMP-like domain